MLPFLLRDITEDFDSVAYIGLYAGLYYVLAYVLRPAFGSLLRKQGVRLSLFISLSLCSMGYLCSAFAPKLWVFVVGRCLSACGAAGIMTIVALLRTCAPDFAWCTQHRAYILLECAALPLGTL